MNQAGDLILELVKSKLENKIIAFVSYLAKNKKLVYKGKKVLQIQSYLYENLKEHKMLINTHMGILILLIRNKNVIFYDKI